MRKPPFKFFNCWATHEDFESVICSAWQTPVDGSPLYQITQKLKLIKSLLKELNNKHFRQAASRKEAVRVISLISKTTRFFTLEILF